MKKVMIPSLDMKKSISVKVDSDLTLLLSSGVYEIKKMEPRWRLRRPIIVVCLFLAIAGIIGFGYYCPDQVSKPQGEGRRGAYLGDNFVFFLSL